MAFFIKGQTGTLLYRHVFLWTKPSITKGRNEVFKDIQLQYNMVQTSIFV